MANSSVQLGWFEGKGSTNKANGLLKASLIVAASEKNEGFHRRNAEKGSDDWYHYLRQKLGHCL